MAEKWTAADIPDQTGKVVIVTGANSGLGFVDARALAAGGGSGSYGLPRYGEGGGSPQWEVSEKLTGVKYDRLA